MRVRATTPERARQLAASFRSSAQDSRSIGLVLHADDVTQMDAVAPELVSAWNRHEVLRELHRSEETRSVLQSEPRVLLDPTDVLVLPRLEAIVDLSRFRAEVARLAVGATTREAAR